MAFARLRSGSNWDISEIVVAAAGASDGRVVASAGGEDAEAIRPGGWWISPGGDHVAYLRGRPTEPGSSTPATLWVVGTDGRGARRLATASEIGNATWDPGGRFIAYTARASTEGSARTALHVVDTQTGADQEIPLPELFASSMYVTDWSRDGRLLGLVTTDEEQWEYWVVEGLQEGGR
jgi:hypothetical protein